MPKRKGSELKNRYFFIVNPLSYIVIGLLGLIVFLNSMKNIVSIFTAKSPPKKILSQSEVEALLFLIVKVKIKEMCSKYGIG